jgi:hypothetical protein
MLAMLSLVEFEAFLKRLTFFIHLSISFIKEDFPTFGLPIKHILIVYFSVLSFLFHVPLEEENAFSGFIINYSQIISNLNLD